MWYGNSWNKTFYSQRVWIGYNIELAEVKVYTPLRLFLKIFTKSIISRKWLFTDDSFQIKVNYFIGCMSSCELFGSLKCHTFPLPNPWRSRGRETFEFRAFYAVWWLHLVIYAFSLWVYVEPGQLELYRETKNSSSYRGKFQWKFDQRKGNLDWVLEHQLSEFELSRFYCMYIFMYTRKIIS